MAEVIRTVKFSKTFKKQYKKLTVKQQKKFDERLVLWQKDPDSPELRRHALQGKHSHLYSINVTGDIRALYEIVGDEIYMYQMIGTHSQLYG